MGLGEQDIFAEAQFSLSTPLPPPLPTQTAWFLLLLGIAAGWAYNRAAASCLSCQKFSPRQQSLSQRLGCAKPSNDPVSDSFQTLCGYNWCSSPGGNRPQACLYPWNQGIFLLFYEPQERGGEVPIISTKSLRHREVRKALLRAHSKTKAAQFFLSVLFSFCFSSFIEV